MGMGGGIADMMGSMFGWYVCIKNKCFSYDILCMIVWEAEWVWEVCTDRDMGRDRDATEIPNHSTKKRKVNLFLRNCNGLILPMEL